MLPEPARPPPPAAINGRLLEASPTANASGAAQHAPQANASGSRYVDAVRAAYSHAAAHAAALRDLAGAQGVPVGRRFTLSSEGYLKWALWRQNVSVTLETA
eukprot:5885518-Prymnesium_polylepis.1